MNCCHKGDTILNVATRSSSGVEGESSMVLAEREDGVHPSKPILYNNVHHGAIEWHPNQRPGLLELPLRLLLRA